MANLETIVSGEFGGISRRTNAKRLWVPTSLMNFVTGTWTFTVASNVTSMNKSTSAETATVYIPFPARFSMGAYASGSGIVDRGVRIVGIEVLALVGTADLSGVATILIQNDAQAANGGALGTSTEITSTKTGLAVTNATTMRRITALIAATDRVFMTDVNTMHCEVALPAASTTVLKVYGAVWHYEEIAD